MINQEVGRDPTGQALVSDQAPAGLAASRFDPSRGLTFAHPTDDEIRTGAKAKWAMSGLFNIDQWPPEVLAVSIPTKFIAVEDTDEFISIFDVGHERAMGKYSAKLDAAMGWDQHFIRLNSRSPKDTAYPGLPITCSGKQAMWWIAGSERCLDDASLHHWAEKPLFICAREWRPIRPAWEFRCFAKDGAVIAVSRYDYGNPSEVDEGASPAIMEAARRFYGEHLAKHYSDVVFDLFAPGTSQQLLIELNPYGLSDPCLFGCYREVERGGIRVGNRDSDEHPKGENAQRLSGEAMPARAESIAQDISPEPLTERWD